MRVLGTRIETARDDDRPRTILLSDLHVPRAGGAVLGWLERVLADAAAEPARTRVLILGDLFEFYATDAQLRLDGWGRMVAALAACTGVGVPVTVLHGNRDFLLGRRFARRTGCRVVAGGLALQLGGRPTLALHGDETCLRDVGYQRSKPLLRGPLTRLIKALAPDRVCFRIAGRLRAESRAGHEPGEFEQRYDATRAAIDTAFAVSGAELLVFGHVHRAARGSWSLGDGRTGEYAVLPAFDEAGLHLRHDGGPGPSAGALRTVGPAGEPAPEPGPRAFS
ncbi:MAG: UDP-2,3-diacylglucosamine diphosphatase [Planctomycetes bacterium]|nr:UDP-2,3-diacylglucosamine diphosphatase [Planctomycetota bacterium]